MNPPFQSRNLLSSKGWPSLHQGFSFARQVPRSPGSKGLPSSRMHTHCSANPFLCPDGEASKAAPTGTNTRWSQQRVTCPPPRDMGQCPQTSLVVVGWQSMDTPSISWVGVKGAADRPAVHRTAPTIKSDPAPAVRMMSHQHPWSRAVPRPEHKTTCVGPWDLRDENGKKIIQLHFQLASKRSLQRNAIIRS